MSSKVCNEVHFHTSVFWPKSNVSSSTFHQNWGFQHHLSIPQPLWFVKAGRHFMLPNHNISRDFKANDCKVNQNLTLNLYLQISTITHYWACKQPTQHKRFCNLRTFKDCCEFHLTFRSSHQPISMQHNINLWPMLPCHGRMSSNFAKHQWLSW